MTLKLTRNAITNLHKVHEGLVIRVLYQWL